MTTTLDAEPVAKTLEDLYARAAEARKKPRPPEEGKSAQERADAAQERYMPIDPEAGKLLYSLIRATRPTTVVEFGMSYGISTIFLAAAVRDNEAGHVITTELNEHKVAAASQTFRDVKLDDLVTVQAGDAVETLGALVGPVDFVLLDGWKELYLPVLKVLEERLSPGTLIAADNASLAGTGAYLDYVRNPSNGYVTFNFPSKADDSMELSCRI